MHLGCRELGCSFKIKRKKPCNTLEDTRKCPSFSNIVFSASAKENQETKQKKLVSIPKERKELVRWSLV